MPEGNDPVPELLVERLLLGDLDPATAAEVRDRLAATDPGRLAAIEATNRTILTAHPAADVFADVQRRLARRRRIERTVPAWALATVAAAAIAIFVTRPHPPPEPGETVTLRGLHPHLIVYRKTPAGPARLTEESRRVHPGDTVQVAYVSAGRRFGVVVSQDERGNLTWHLPTGGAEAAPLAGAGETPLANAFELDDRPGFERFVFATSDQPFPLSVVRDALRSRGQPALPPGVGVTEVVLKKEVP
jgi:hypothetical protein